MNNLRTGLVALIFGLTAVCVAQPQKRVQEKAYYLQDYLHAADFIGNKDGKASDDEIEVVHEAIFRAMEANTKYGYIPWIIVDDTVRLIHPYIPENSIPDPKFGPIDVIQVDTKFIPYTNVPKYAGFDATEMELRKSRGQVAPEGLRGWDQEALHNNIYGLYEINLHGQLTGIFLLTKNGYKKLNDDTYKNKPLLTQ